MTLSNIIKSLGGSLANLTVMSSQTDPYRIDTPANHRNAKWLADTWAACSLTQIHTRGLHYALVSLPGLVKPDGTQYMNTHQDWIFLQRVVNHARWLGYLEFDAIVDERNAGPEIFLPPTYEQTSIEIELDTGCLTKELNLPEINIACHPSHARQAYRLVLIGEKSSLRSVLHPICQKFEAELVLPTGELSTTLLHGILSRAAADGRPCRVFYLSDFDPTGFHMPLEVERKVQALCDLKFPDLDVELRRCALLQHQVQSLGLPATPLKATEKRASKWRDRFGCEQTEIDALATLRPEILAKIVEGDLSPYFDSTLQKRLEEAEWVASDETQERIDAAWANYGPEVLEAQQLISAADAALEMASIVVCPLLDEIVRSIEVVQSEPVQPELDEGAFVAPLFSSRNSFAVTTTALLGEKL